jgi:hypothetical protein
VTRSRALTIAIIATSTLAIGGLTLAWTFHWANTSAPATTSSTKNGVGEHGTCVLLVPTLRDAQIQVLSIVDHPDGSALDRARLATLLDDFITIKDIAPAHMADDIAAQHETIRLVNLADGKKRTIDLEPFRASGLRLAARCAPYAG